MIDYIRVTDEIELIVNMTIPCYTDEDVTIFTQQEKDYGLFLIRYGDQYYTAIDTLDHIIDTAIPQIINMDD